MSSPLSSGILPSCSCFTKIDLRFSSCLPIVVHKTGTARIFIGDCRTAWIFFLQTNLVKQCYSIKNNSIANAFSNSFSTHFLNVACTLSTTKQQLSNNPSNNYGLIFFLQNNRFLSHIIKISLGLTKVNFPGAQWASLADPRTTSCLLGTWWRIQFRREQTRTKPWTQNIKFLLLLFVFHLLNWGFQECIRF